MLFQSRVLFTSAFLACGVLFAQPGFSQTAATAELATEEDAADEEVKDDSREGRRPSTAGQPARVTSNGIRLPEAEADLSSALISSPIETAELIIEGTDVKVGLIGNLVDDSFADANNTKSHFIPAYTVWDLTEVVKFLNGRSAFSPE